MSGGKLAPFWPRGQILQSFPEFPRFLEVVETSNLRYLIFSYILTTRLILIKIGVGDFQLWLISAGSIQEKWELGAVNADLQQRLQQTVALAHMQVNFLPTRLYVFRVEDKHSSCKAWCNCRFFDRPTRFFKFRLLSSFVLVCINSLGLVINDWCWHSRFWDFRILPTLFASVYLIPMWCV